MRMRIIDIFIAAWHMARAFSFATVRSLIQSLVVWVNIIHSTMPQDKRLRRLVLCLICFMVCMVGLGLYAMVALPQLSSRPQFHLLSETSLKKVCSFYILVAQYSLFRDNRRIRRWRVCSQNTCYRSSPPRNIVYMQSVVVIERQTFVVEITW